MGRVINNKDKMMGSYKKGGKVKKTGAYILHKGEKVIPSKKMKSVYKGIC